MYINLHLLIASQFCVRVVIYGHVLYSQIVLFSRGGCSVILAIFYENYHSSAGHRYVTILLSSTSMTHTLRAAR